MDFDNREQQREQQTQREKDQRRQELDDLRAVLRTSSGRRFIWCMLEDAGILHDAFTGNSNTYYILGKQAYGKRLFADILKHFPKQYIQMQNEASARQMKEEPSNA
jgi:hypothetical protein